MRDLPPDYEAHILSGVTTLCTCWLIERCDGATLGFTDHDRGIEIDGTICQPESGGSASTLQSSADLSVDNSSIEGVLSSSSVSDTDLDHGLYDGAKITIWRVNWLDANVRLLMKTGEFGEVTRSGVGFHVEMRGLTHKLDKVTGRRFQHQCDAVLGDGKCGVDLSTGAYSVDGSVISASGTKINVNGGESYQSHWFSNGIVKITSGSADTLILPIKSHLQTDTSARLILRQPAPAALQAGDMVTLIAGCDRKFATCRDKFSNQLNFRGFPSMPGNDAVTRYPVSGETHDGGKRS